MAIHIVLLAVFDVLLVFRLPVAHHHSARVPARATGTKTKDFSRRAAPSAPLTHATIRNPAV
jgi:hypothetical protein